MADRHIHARVRFQSTLPVWGATQPAARPAGDAQVSIHAPRVGSDEQGKVKLLRGEWFQSTLPVWGATSAPEGALISVVGFNPRSPCGERRAYGDDMRRSRKFQSTLPVWGATFHM